MPQDDSPWFDRCTRALRDPRDQRVWSLIVSLFGDLAQEPGATLSGQALTRILVPMGIRPEAIRVALHRLRKDGWIESRRAGRSSVHYLSAFGRAQSAQVTPRIYDRAPVVPQDWHLLIAEDPGGLGALDDLLLTADYVSVGRNVALGAGPAPGAADPATEDFLTLRVSPVHVPGWLRARLCPDDLAAACKALAEALETCLAQEPARHDLTPFQTATLRTLIVHRWRRVVLRHPDMPPAFFPADWAGPVCRDRVFRLLDSLPRPDPQTLEPGCAG